MAPFDNSVRAARAGLAVAACGAGTVHAQPAPVAHKTPESELLSPGDVALRRKLQPFMHCLNLVGTRCHAWPMLTCRPSPC